MDSHRVDVVDTETLCKIEITTHVLCIGNVEQSELVIFIDTGIEEIAQPIEQISAGFHTCAYGVGIGAIIGGQACLSA